MENKSLKLVHGIINSCIFAHGLFNFLKDLKQEDGMYGEGVMLAVKSSLYESWWAMKKVYGKREFKKIVYGYLISDHRRQAFEDMDNILQDYHDSKFKKG